ncbi:MAG: ADP-glyceromanno-heptose 6-epimerase [Leptospiraceae bacterium]|nr:ADP-glyceromanno-heptose 6-epimerase [Leptospiraceae bacterium]
MQRKYIVTGGAGLIGSSVIEELNRIGESDILVVDHLGTTEKWKNLTRLKFSDYVEKDRFLEMVLNGEAFQKVTHCIHLGACSSTTEKDATYLIENNYKYTQILGAFCMTRGIRFLYASSAATYGEGENGYIEENLESLKPLNMYGYSKHLYDLYASRYKFLDKITSVKYFNVFGFGEEHKGEMRSLVLKGYEQIKSSGKLKLFKSYRPEFKDGEQKRDFLYSRDAAKATLHLLHNNHYGIYNIGRGVAETWNSVANALFKAMKLTPKIEYIEMPEHLKGKYQYFTQADISKLMSTSYSDGFMDLENSIQEYISRMEN